MTMGNAMVSIGGGFLKGKNWALPPARRRAVHKHANANYLVNCFSCDGGTDEGDFGAKVKEVVTQRRDFRIPTVAP